MRKISEVYCEKCGKKLVDAYKFSHFNFQDGEKLYTVTSVCPNKKWYNRHTRFFRTKINYDAGFGIKYALLCNEDGIAVNID